MCAYWNLQYGGGCGDWRLTSNNGQKHLRRLASIGSWERPKADPVFDPDEDRRRKWEEYKKAHHLEDKIALPAPAAIESKPEQFHGKPIPTSDLEEAMKAARIVDNIRATRLRVFNEAFILLQDLSYAWRISTAQRMLDHAIKSNDAVSIDAWREAISAFRRAA